MDAGARAKQEARAENDYTIQALPCINTKQTAAKTNLKDLHALYKALARSTFILYWDFQRIMIVY